MVAWKAGATGLLLLGALVPSLLPSLIDGSGEHSLWLHLLFQAWTSTSFFVLVTGPAFLGAVLGFWYWSDLPDHKGIALLVTGALWTTFLGSMVLLCIPAFSGSMAARCALLVYLSIAVLACCYSVYGHIAELFNGGRRMFWNFAYLVPIIIRYLTLDKWKHITNMGKADFEKHKLALDRRCASQLFTLIVRQRGLYVKLGQILSLFPRGTLPDAYLDQCSKLQGEVPPVTGHKVRDLLTKAFGRPLDEIFSSFEDSPLGAASIGQVHRARLKADGRDVVIKLQYPDVSEGVWADFASAKLLVKLFKQSLLTHVNKAKSWLEKELDFQSESRDLRRVHDNMRNAFPHVMVPSPIESLCTPQVVVMTFVPGVSLLEIVLRTASSVLGSKITRALEKALLQPGPGSESICLDAPRPASGALSCILAAGLAALVAVRRARRLALLRGFGRALLASGGALSLVVAVQALRQHSAAGAPAVALRMALVQVMQHLLARWRDTRNAGISLYNVGARVVGAEPVEHLRAIPKINPVQVSMTIWLVQGHQLLIDGIFNTDAHPGNFLVDEATGKLGLLDFGQTCEIPLSLRVLIARQVIALATGDEREIALRHAQLGFRTKRMTIVVLAANARLKYGPMTVKGLEGIIRQIDRLTKWDPITDDPAVDIPDMIMVDRSLILLRGTAAMLGAPLDTCCASQMWLPMARKLVAEHGHLFPAEEIELSSEMPELPKS